MPRNVYRGLKGLQEAIDKSSGGGGKWLKLKGGEEVKIHFLQEIDDGSKFYNKDAGLTLIVPEHNVPGQFPKKFLCTKDDDGEPCLGCERFEQDPQSRWKAKSRFYVNVLVDNGKDDPFDDIMNKGIGHKAVTPDLFEFATDNGGITFLQWKLKRKGSGENDTEWSASPLLGTEPVDPSKYELFDLEEVVIKDVPYDKQEEYCLSASSAEGQEKTQAAIANEDW